LDACCLSRLTDDQSQPRIVEEAIAIEKVFSLVRLGSVELISSEALADEVRRIRTIERRLQVQTLLSLSIIEIEMDQRLSLRAAELSRLGYGVYDSLHLAASESVGAVLLSTDDRFIKRAARRLGRPRTSVSNPVSWIREQK